MKITSFFPYFQADAHPYPAGLRPQGQEKRTQGPNGKGQGERGGKGRGAKAGAGTTTHANLHRSQGVKLEPIFPIPTMCQTVYLSLPDPVALKLRLCSRPRPPLSRDGRKRDIYPFSSVSSLRYSIRTVKHTYIVKSHAGVPKHPVSKEERKNLESILSYKYK